MRGALADGKHLRVPLHGAVVEVPRAALSAELARTGPIASLALVEAIVRHAPRAAAITRLIDGLGEDQHGTVILTTLLALVRLEAQEAITALSTTRFAAPLDASARVALHLLGGSLTELADEIAADEQIAQRAPLVLSALPRARAGTTRVFSALLAALDLLQPTLGVTAYRALLGDVAEAAFRCVQRGTPADALLGGERGALVDRLAAELPGTTDLVAARGMAWLLGTLAPSDDAVRSAIERASARFRDPAFHRDCAAMLDEDPARPWPPAAPL